MVQDPFPDRGRDGEEPGGSRPAPAGSGPEASAPQPGGPQPDGGLQGPADSGRVGDDDRQGPEQGLFVCLPAEELSLAGFAQGGVLVWRALSGRRYATTPTEHPLWPEVTCWAHATSV